MRAMGVERLCAASRGACGVHIAILDSGCPKYAFGGGIARSCVHSSGLDDEYGHATAISSILFGGRGIVGICEACHPLYVKVLDDNGCGTIESVVAGIHEALNYNVDLINLSLGFIRTEKCPESLEKACEAAFEAGKPIICAAGNDGGRVNWPAALKTTICVGSEAKNGLKTAFSSVGEVDFVAPGLNLPVFGVDGRIKMVSGTSFSTALVTGVAACLIRKMHVDGVKISVEGVKNALKGVAIDLGEPGWDENTGYGLVFGEKVDPTAHLKIGKGFFGKILDEIRATIRLLTKPSKGVQNGRV